MRETYGAKLRKHANNKISIAITVIKEAKQKQLYKYILAVMQPESDITHRSTLLLKL